MNDSLPDNNYAELSRTRRGHLQVLWGDRAIRTLVVLGGIGCVLAVLLFPVSAGSWLVGLGVFSLVATLFGYEWTSYVLLGILPLAWLQGVEGVLILPSEGRCLLYLLMAGVWFRYLEIRRYTRTVFFRPSPEEKNAWQFPSVWGGRWWMIGVACLSAMLVLSLFPLDWEAPRKYSLRPVYARVIILLGGLFLLWLCSRSLFQLVSRWTMTRQQADVYRRAMVAREYWHDQASVEKRRARELSKQFKEELP